MEELKPCPFCGCNNVKMFYDERQNYHVECYGCGKTVSFHIAKDSSWKKAVENYNHRTAPGNKPYIVRLEGLLDDIVLARLDPDEVIACANKLKDALTDLCRAEPGNKPLTCEGCRNNGQFEELVEYGLPSPCTGCKRRSPDRYDARKPEGSESDGSTD